MFAADKLIGFVGYVKAFYLRSRQEFGATLLFILYAELLFASEIGSTYASIRQSYWILFKSVGKLSAFLAELCLPNTFRTIIQAIQALVHANISCLVFLNPDVK